MDDTLVESGRLLIRRFEEKDGPFLERVFCDPGMMRYLGSAWDAPKVMEALQEWRADWGIENRWYGMLVKKDTLEPVGTAGITENTIPDEPGLELSWFVLPEHQRQGFASEITQSLLGFAFSHLKAARLVAETHPQNPASNRVLEKLGFVCLGERRHTYDDLPGFDVQVLWELTRENYQLEQVISSIPVWQAAREIRRERIAGLTNTNYRITVDGERFVLRLSGENTGRLGIDRACELAALQAAAAADLGPQVVAFLLPQGHMVTRWIDGRYWGAPEFRTAAHVRLLTQTAKGIHALPSNGAVFSPFQRVASYLGTARDLGVAFPPGFDGFLETMRTVERDQEQDASGWQRFCHNDLASVNYLFLEAENCLKVLDWEFAGLGDIYYDLAGIVYTHDSEGPLPAGLEEVMLAEYFGQVTPWHRRRLRGMKYMLMLFTGMWGLAQHGMQQAGLIPAPQDFDYLEFAQTLFAQDIRELQTRIINSQIT